ncbi:hypothetical protein C0583_06035 [Candidatus Parcubacteria bacterium]|nr:MAG: hypothetical protein C0583_06035 [Candidatus Parcubacteria bacterium]
MDQDRKLNKRDLIIALIGLILIIPIFIFLDKDFDFSDLLSIFINNPAWLYFIFGPMIFVGIGYSLYVGLLSMEQRIKIINILKKLGLAYRSVYRKVRFIVFIAFIFWFIFSIIFNFIKALNY